MGYNYANAAKNQRGLNGGLNNMSYTDCDYNRRIAGFSQEPQNDDMGEELGEVLARRKEVNGFQSEVNEFQMKSKHVNTLNDIKAVATYMKTKYSSDKNPVAGFEIMKDDFLYLLDMIV